MALFIKANVEGKLTCKSLDPSFVSQSFNTEKMLSSYNAVLLVSYLCIICVIAV